MSAHAKAAKAFLANKENAVWHDQTLYMVRHKRDLLSHTITEWEDLRHTARDIKLYSNSHLPELIEQFEKNAIVRLSGGEIISSLNAAGVMTKLMQIASGASYSEAEDHGYVNIDTARYELVVDLAKQREHSVVFFNWQHQKDQLVKELERQGLTYVVIDGTTSDKARKEAVDRFQKGFYRVLLAHPQTAAHGLTLTRGTATIWASPTYNLEHWLQGNRRIYRAGQKQKTETIVVLAPGTIEDKVFKKLTDKNVRQLNMLNFLQEIFQ